MFNCLAIDIGAGSGRVMRCTISDDSTVSLEEVSRFPNDSAVRDGHLRWNLADLMRDIKAGLEKGAKERKPDAVAVDTWGVDYVLLDARKNLLADPVCYRDSRTSGLAAEFNAAFGRDRISRLTGTQIMDINTVYQLYAQAKENPAYAEKADQLLFIPDYIASRLCGAYHNEFTIASTSQLLNCSTADWADELLDAVNLPRHCVRSLTLPGTKIGDCAFSGIDALKGVPFVMVGSHDTASGVAAAPARGTDWAYIASGTWCLTGIESPVALPTPRAIELNFTNEGGVAGTWRVLKNLTGFWILRGLKADVAPDLSYDELMAKAWNSAPFRSLFNPNDALFFNPESMKSAADAFFTRSGQPLPDSPGAYIRSFLESLALLFRKTIREADSISGRTTRVVHLMGGGAQNPQLCQATANATGCLVMAGPVEATALGNGMMQAIACGVLPDLAAARKLIRDSFRPAVYEPCDTAAWDEAALKFEKIVK